MVIKLDICRLFRTLCTQQEDSEAKCEEFYICKIHVMPVCGNEMYNVFVSMGIEYFCYATESFQKADSENRCQLQ